MEILESWTLQMGYPLVSVTRKDSSSLSVSQSYFLISTDDQPNYEDSEGSAKYRFVNGYKTIKMSIRQYLFNAVVYLNGKYARTSSNVSRKNC